MVKIECGMRRIGMHHYRFIFTLIKNQFNMRRYSYCDRNAFRKHFYHVFQKTTDMIQNKTTIYNLSNLKES